MKGVILYVVLCAVYMGCVFFNRKKEKPSIWNSLIFAGVVFLLAIIFKTNYLIQFPNLKNTNFIMALIYSSILSFIVGYYGKYQTEKCVSKWNVWMIRPAVLEFGFTGLVLPYIHRYSILRDPIDVGFFPVTIGILVVAVTETVLNLMDKEYKMKLRNQILYDLAAVILNALLAILTGSVWLLIIPRGVYALSRWYREYHVKKY